MDMTQDSALQRIQALWCEVLQLPPSAVQHDSHFLQLGGDSLQLTRLLARVEQQLGHALHALELSRIATPQRMLDCCAGMAARASAVAVAERPAPVTPENWIVPATPVQQGIWLAEQIALPQQLYLASVRLDLYGTLDVAALQSACTALFQRHPVLSACLRHDLATRRLLLDCSAAFSRVEAAASPITQALEVVQITGSAELPDQIAAVLQQPMPLEQGPLCRMTLLQLAPQRHVLLLSCHHSISDGWSGGLLLQQLATYYAAALRHGQLSPPVPDAGLLEHARATAHTAAAVQDEPALQWWREQLDGCEAGQQWLWQRQCPPTEPWPHPLAQYAVALPQALIDGLRRQAQAGCHSLFILFLHALRHALYCCSGVRQQTVLVPMARRLPQQEQSIGCFIEVLLVPGTLHPELSPADALAAEARAFDIAQKQQLPWPLLTSALRPRLLPDSNAWTSVLFAFQSFPQPSLHWPGLQHHVVAVPDRCGQYALKLEVVPGAADWILRIDYACALLQEMDVVALADAMRAALHSLQR